MKGQQHPPAQIIAQLLRDIEGDLLVDTVDTKIPVFITDMPDSPDNLVTVYDTVGTRDGRVLTGESIEHPGWQIRLRHTSYEKAYRQMGRIVDLLDLVHNDVIEFLRPIAGTNTSVLVRYEVQNMSRTSDILPLNTTVADRKNRTELTINGIITSRTLMVSVITN